MLHRVVLYSHGFFITHFHLCFFRFSAISIESEQLNSLEIPTQNNGENKDFKGKIPEHHDVVTSTYSCELRHGTRNYTQIWAVVTVNVENMCFCRPTETRCSSDSRRERVVIFISEGKTERMKEIGSTLSLTCPRKDIYLFINDCHNAERCGVYMHFLF